MIHRIEPTDPNVVIWKLGRRDDHHIELYGNGKLVLFIEGDRLMLYYANIEELDMRVMPRRQGE